MHKEKSQPFIYHGLGFPIHLYNFPMKKYWGVEMADIDYNKFKRAMIELLAQKPVPLTGNEMRFIRQYFKMNYTQFAQQLGQTRQAIAKWESQENDFALITPSMEFYIRLWILNFLKVSDKVFRNIFNKIDMNSELKKKKHDVENIILKICPSDIENLIA